MLADQDKPTSDPLGETSSCKSSVNDNSNLPPNSVDPSAEAFPPALEVLQLEEAPENAASIGVSKTTGNLKTTKGVLIAIVTCTAHMSSVNTALPTMAKELNIASGNLPWIVSVYTLAFGSHLLLAGVLADRFGKRPVFCGGMLWLTIWSLAVSFAKNEVSLIIFRPFRGLGAAATVPSSIGLICTYFSGRDQNLVMVAFGGTGSFAFTFGVVFGGVLSGSIGWRYIFRILASLTAILAVSGWFIFPGEAKDLVDRAQAIVGFRWGGAWNRVGWRLTFRAREMHGWNKVMDTDKPTAAIYPDAPVPQAIVIAPLVFLSVVTLGAFLFAERKVKNPIMPLQLWKTPGFAGTWFTALIFQAWRACLHYLILIAQEVLLYSPLSTAARCVPLGIAYFSHYHGILRWLFRGKILGQSVALLLSARRRGLEHSDRTAIALVASVPPSAKSLAGGLVNTAFQIGVAIGLAVCSIVTVARPPHPDETDPYARARGLTAGLWMATGFGGMELPS
ncbi:hypothetical protein NliqN6_5421 [Naganishia liquefaciens]|uniref:Major facilitator superfamily (MFS) profile domain-containing protein n=1 Tax=Naganishia liquefaciens TaxID=104408 RepID=A0A8H3YGQ6_9TREE|nr:hypothetical protein NliqN6_5421 [Naganishia liquefaciens]